MSVYTGSEKGGSDGASERIRQSHGQQPAASAGDGVGDIVVGRERSLGSHDVRWDVACSVLRQFGDRNIAVIRLVVGMMKSGNDRYGTEGLEKMQTSMNQQVNNCLIS
jgi:hypothetical protein